MNNHPKGIQQKSLVTIYLNNNGEMYGPVASADNIGITLMVLFYKTENFADYEYQKSESVKYTFVPWNAIDYVDVSPAATKAETEALNAMLGSVK